MCCFGWRFRGVSPAVQRRSPYAFGRIALCISPGLPTPQRMPMDDNPARRHRGTCHAWFSSRLGEFQRPCVCSCGSRRLHAKLRADECIRWLQEAANSHDAHLLPPLGAFRQQLEAESRVHRVVSIAAWHARFAARAETLRCTLRRRATRWAETRGGDQIAAAFHVVMTSICPEEIRVAFVK